MSCEDLILHKLLAGRLIDLADAVALMSANHPALDATYLENWPAQLGVSAELQRSWREATSAM